MNRKDNLGIAAVVVAFGLLAASTLVLLQALDELWSGRGIVFQLTDLLAVPFGGNRDVPVLVFVGAIAGWFLLFWVDATKRIQGAIVFVVAVVAVGPYLQETRHILDAVGRTSWALVLGVVVGIGSGLLSARLIGADRPTGVVERLQWLRYPGAAAAFRHAGTAVIGLSLVDYVLYSGGETGTALVVASGVVFVLSLSVFLQYGFERRVVAVSPAEGAEGTNYQPYVLGGLYELASERYGAFSTGRGDMGGLTEARVTRSVSRLPSFSDAVAFSFSSTRLRSWPDSGDPLARLKRFLLPRPVTVESNGITTNRIGAPDSPEASSRAAASLRYVLGRLRYHAMEVIPAFVRDAFPERGRNTIDRLDQAGTVLLVGPTPAEKVDDADWVDSFSSICDRYADNPGTDVVLATIEAGPVADEDNFAMADQAFKRRIASRIGIDSSALSMDDVYPLDRFSGSDAPDSEFDDLLRRLSR